MAVVSWCAIFSFPITLTGQVQGSSGHLAAAVFALLGLSSSKHLANYCFNQKCVSLPDVVWLMGSADALASPSAAG